MLTSPCCCDLMQADRVAYLCNKQAKVVAMTCTHAALKRREFLNLGLKYDNIVMEEAGQVCTASAGSVSAPWGRWSKSTSKTASAA